MTFATITRDQVSLIRNQFGIDLEEAEQTISDLENSIESISSTFRDVLENFCDVAERVEEVDSLKEDLEDLEGLQTELTTLLSNGENDYPDNDELLARVRELVKFRDSIKALLAPTTLPLDE